VCVKISLLANIFAPPPLFSFLFCALVKGRKIPYRDIDIVKSILSRPDVDVNCRTLTTNMTPLNRVCCAVAFENPKHATGLSPPHKPSPPTALVERCTELVKILLTRDDIDVNIPNLNNAVPVYSAGELGCASIVKLLLDTGKCDPNICAVARRSNIGSDSSRVPLLRMVCTFGHVDVARHLLDYKGTDITIHDLPDPRSSPIPHFASYASLPLHASCLIGHTVSL
jgi:hypothetical protein